MTNTSILACGELRTFESAFRTWDFNFDHNLRIHTWDYCTETKRRVDHSTLKNVNGEVVVHPAGKSPAHWNKWSVCRQIFLWKEAVANTSAGSDILVIVRPDCAFSTDREVFGSLLEEARSRRGGEFLYTTFQTEDNPFSDICWWGTRRAVETFVHSLSVDEFLFAPDTDIHSWLHRRAQSLGIVVETRKEMRTMILRPIASQQDLLTGEGWDEATRLNAVDWETRVK